MVKPWREFDPDASGAVKADANKVVGYDGHREEYMTRYDKSMQATRLLPPMESWMGEVAEGFCVIFRKAFHKRAATNILVIYTMMVKSIGRIELCTRIAVDTYSHLSFSVEMSIVSNKQKGEKVGLG